MGSRTLPSWILRVPGKQLAWAVLLLGLGVTVLVWHSARSQAMEAAEAAFNARAGEVAQAVGGRLAAYEQMLRGGVALFYAGGDISRTDWRIYVSQLSLDQSFPGIQGMGFAPALQPDALAALTEAVRAEGFPAFGVRPAGERELYGPVVLIEPFDERNQRAFGYDMYSDPTRRAAMAQARDTGRTASTAPVRLVQENGENVQAGFLMYLPVYEGAQVPDTLGERRRLLRGWVFAPYRMENLMAGILGRWQHELELRIYDGPQVDPRRLMFNSAEALSPVSRFRYTVTATVTDRPWTLELVSDRPTEARIGDGGLPRLITGTVISLLVFGIAWTLATTRERAERLAEEMFGALRESQAKYGAMVENAFDAMVVADRAGRVVTWNPAAERMFGYSEAEMVGQPLTIVLPQRYQDSPRGALAVLRQLGRSPAMGRVTRMTGRRNGGMEFPLELSVSYWLVNQQGFYSAIIRDITEREQAHEAVRISEARFRTTFVAAGVGIVISDMGDRVLEANPAFHRMLGFQPGEMQGHRIGEHVHPDEADEVSARRSLEQLGDQVQLTRTVRYIHHEGHLLWARLTISFVRDEWGEPQFAIRLIEDITELKQAEEALQRANAELERRVEERTRELQERGRELERSNQELEQFAYIASHDLQEPLRSVSGFAQLLARRYRDKLDTQGQEFVDFIIAGSDRMRGLITDLLAYSRAGAGSEPLGRVSMEAVLERALANLTAAIDSREAEIGHDPLPEVMGREGDLLYLLQNLIGNALKFTEGRPRVHVGVSDAGGFWRFCVRDNGIGIDPEHYERIFQIFQRLHRDGYQGSGVGLAICKKMVERHHGRLWVESTPGEGSTFYFTLQKAVG